MTYKANMDGKPVYAGGASTVNIRENVTVESAVIGNVPAGGVLGTATGNLFPDLERGVHDWYEIDLPDGRLGYVRQDVASLSAPAEKKTPGTSGSDVDTGGRPYPAAGGFPKWGMAVVIVCLLLLGLSVWLLIRKRKGKK